MRYARVPGEIHRSSRTGKFRKQGYFRKVGSFSGERGLFETATDAVTGTVGYARDAVVGTVGLAKDVALGSLNTAGDFLENPLTPSTTTALVLGGLALVAGFVFLLKPKTVTPARPQPPVPPVPVVPGPGPQPPPGGVPTPTARTVTLTETDSGTAVTAAPGDTIMVILSQDASTGYAWGLVAGFDPNVLAQGPGPIPVPASGTDGSGGVPGGTTMNVAWTFYVKAPGNTTLQFTYQRPWEAGSPAKTAQYTVSVAVGANAGSALPGQAGGGVMGVPGVGQVVGSGPWGNFPPGHGRGRHPLPPWRHLPPHRFWPYGY